MSYDEEIKRIQDELRAESEKAFSLDEGAQGKDGLGANTYTMLFLSTIES